MSVDQLHKDELLFELAIRGQKCHAKTNVDKLKKDLKALMAKEGTGVPPGLEIEVDPSLELDVIESKIDVLEDLVENIRDATDTRKVPRFKALKDHVRSRIHFVLPYCESKAQRDLMRAHLKNLKEVVKEFKEKGEGKSLFDVKSVTTIPETVKDDSEKEKSKKESRKERDSEEEREEEKDRKEGPVKNKVLDFHKWNLKFSGAKDKSVLSFIMDAEEKAAYRGVGQEQLLLGATEFFEGYAKNWFRTVQNRIDSWAELKIALRVEFLPMDYMENLWEEVRNRKQGPEETMGVYITNMLALFGRMELVDKEIKDELKLNIISKNLAPFYLERLALVDVLSIDKLKSLGRQLEVGKDRIERYEGGKGRPRPTEPEFAYKGKKVTVNALASPTPSTPSTPSPQSKGPTGPSPSRPPGPCWKCGVPGHRFADCKAPSTGKFCYGCGRKDTIKRDCPKCGSRGGPTTPKSVVNPEATPTTGEA